MSNDGRRTPRKMYTDCPRCGLRSRLNWRLSKKLPQTLVIGVQPDSRVPVSIDFRCPVCAYEVSLGFDIGPYDLE